MAVRWLDIPCMVAAQMPAGALGDVGRCAPATCPWSFAVNWNRAPMTCWSGAVAQMPTLSPGWNPSPSKKKSVPGGPQLGLATALREAGMPEQSVFGLRVGVAVGCAGAGVAVALPPSPGVAGTTVGEPGSGDLGCPASLYRQS